MAESKLASHRHELHLAYLKIELTFSILRFHGDQLFLIIQKKHLLKKSVIPKIL